MIVFWFLVVFFIVETLQLFQAEGFFVVLLNSAERRGDKDLARKYRRQYVDLKSEIDFYAFNLINWN